MSGNYQFEPRPAYHFFLCKKISLNIVFFCEKKKKNERKEVPKNFHRAEFPSRLMALLVPERQLRERNFSFCQQ